jgi:predicted dehydrogenase
LEKYTMFTEGKLLQRPLRWAMVGGGKGSQIGYSHRDAAGRDALVQLVAGAFDIDAARGREFGTSIGLDPLRCYADYQSMFAAEALRADGIEAVTIATPNNSHYAITKAALLAGLHVICEKPLTIDTTEAEELRDLAQAKGRVLAVMYGYTGYEMVQQARAMVQNGELGDIRIIQMQFAHGYHATEVEGSDPGTKWRVTPAVSGPTYVIGDLATHCFQMGALISGLKVESLSCMRSSFVASRAPLEDDAHVMIRYHGNAVGTVWASAVNIGSAHGIKVRVIGSKGSVEWWDEHPNQLKVAFIGKPEMTYERGHGYLDSTARFERVGGGHPAGYFDAWANLYRRFALAMSSEPGARALLGDQWIPTVEDGLEGVRFMLCCAQSADAGSQWIPVP